MSESQCTVMLNLLHDTLHERRLTLTVLTNESYLITTLNRQISIAEYHFVSVCLSNTLHDDRVTARTG